MTIQKEIINNLISENAKTRKDFVRIVGDVYSKHQLKGYHRNIILRDTYDEMVAKGEIEPSETLEKLLITKKMRSLSGVSIITVLTKPFDCPGKCIFCPTEVDVPKSYLSNEPAVMRAILCDYDPKKQVQARLESLARQGHPVDKIEIIVIGGTFSYLPKDYQEEYIKGCFDALNGKVSKTLDEAKKLNEKAKSRCVGLTLETRPDYIDEEEIRWFRYLGATRVELGIQSIYDDVLLKNSRGHKVSETVRATKLLKNAAFKICYHMMPNLYGSDLARDKKMFRGIFTNPDFCPDYIKIYPCVVMAGTGLEELYKRGEYHPYTDEELIELISDVKKHVPYWVRIMRTIRDIPAVSILAGSKTSNLRQVILARAEKEDWKCNCIRCREAGNVSSKYQVASSKHGSEKLFAEKYEASEGTEYFLSFESEDRKVLYSLLRLRLSSLDTRYLIHDTLLGCALIREVHTYGQQAEIGEKGETQHKGYGRKLLAEAEKIAIDAGYKKMAVISGVGVREYYKKFGYELVGEYMVKDL